MNKQVNPRGAMNRIERVRTAVDEHLSSLYDLLAIRLMHPPSRIEVTIEQEIKDLYTYPERLDASYRDEWRSIAIRACFDHGFEDHWRSDQENLERYITRLQREDIPRCIHDNIPLFRSLGEIFQILESDNTLHFPDPRRKALMSLIWPQG